MQNFSKKQILLVTILISAFVLTVPMVAFYSTRSSEVRSGDQVNELEQDSTNELKSEPDQPLLFKSPLEIFLSSYTLEYPSEWSVSEEYFSDTFWHRFTAQKGSTTIEIYQAGGDGEYCNYDLNDKRDNIVNLYNSEFEQITGDSFDFRIHKKEDNKYSVCISRKDSDFYTLDLSDVGFISLESDGNSNDLLDAFAILSSIKINNTNRQQTFTSEFNPEISFNHPGHWEVKENPASVVIKTGHDEFTLKLSKQVPGDKPHCSQSIYETTGNTVKVMTTEGDIYIDRKYVLFEHTYTKEDLSMIDAYSLLPGWEARPDVRYSICLLTAYMPLSDVNDNQYLSLQIPVIPNDTSSYDLANLQSIIRSIVR